jgi:hypothetical protein
MDARNLSSEIADPIGNLGAAFYFSPASAAQADAIGIGLGGLYALGRGGVMGEVDAARIDEVFFFFKSSMIRSMAESGLRSVDGPTAAAAALRGAADFGRERFAEVDEAILAAFVEAARALSATLPASRWPLVDGYLAMPRPEGLAAEAYFWVVLLRELRFAVHADAVRAAGMSAANACQTDSLEVSFELHGFGDEDRVELTDELLATRARVDTATDEAMAALLEPLSDEQRDALNLGTFTMLACHAAKSAREAEAKA